MLALMAPLPGGPDPEREMRRVHRIFHDMQQLVGERLQVNFLSKRRRESFQCACGVVAAAVEAAVNATLEATAQRLEERGGQQRGCDDSQCRFLMDAGNRLNERLNADDAEEVDSKEDGC